jgi:hypothetical protein
MKHPANCDCKCAQTACTKWVLHYPLDSQNDPVVFQNREPNGVYDHSNNIYGPGDRILHDAEFCRTTIDFAYDEDTFEQIVSIQVPPHIDCGSADTSACRRRVIETEHGWDAVEAGGFSAAGTSKVIKLRKGQRVRVRLVTDSVIDSVNTPKTELFWNHSSSYTAGVYRIIPSTSTRCTPIVTVAPAQSDVWDERKICKITTHPLEQEEWYEAGVWPYTNVPDWTAYNGDAIPDGSGFNQINRSQPTRTYGMVRSFYSPNTCYMPAEAGVPPEVHPAAPIVDMHPTMYTANPRPQAFNNLMPVQYLYTPPWTLSGGVYSPPDPGASTDSTTVAGEYTLQNWFLSKYMTWPLTAVWVDLDTTFPSGSDDARYRASFFSAPESFQVQPDDTNPTGVPITEAPFKTYMLCVPSISRGWSTGPDGSRNLLRPDYPTDTGYVADQIAGWEALFENVTIHSLELPEYPMRSTARPRTVRTDGVYARPYTLEYTPSSPTDYTGMDGLQNGCVNQGVCDIEMVVEIDKTGPWVFCIVDPGNSLTYSGSTSVITFVIEEPDPDNEGEWIAFDAREACDPEPTPDHTGWVNPHTYITAIGWYYGGPFYVYGVASFGVRNVRVDQAKPCDRADINAPPTTTGKYVSYLIQDDNLYDVLLANGSMITAGDTFTDFRTQSAYYTSAWAVIPEYVLNQYYNKTRLSLCCGYDTVSLPLLTSSCHHHNNWADIQGLTLLNSQNFYQYRKVYQSGTPNPALNWILPW